MKKTNTFTLLVLFTFLFNTTLFAQQTQLLLLPTIHTLHQKNNRYSFENIFKIIENYKPDIIAVEIRPEDMQQDTAYLKMFYQPEMILMKNNFPDIQKAGIDDFGSDVRGKLLTADFLKDTTTQMGRFRVLNRRMNKDTAIVNAFKQKGLPALRAKQGEMLSTASAAELLDGRYDKITGEYYAGLAEVLAKTPYAEYEKFSSTRDQKITDNIRKLVKNNPGKKIIVLSGANHHNQMTNALSKMKNVKLITEVKDY